MERGNSYLFRSGARKSDLDSALVWLSSARREADATGDVYYRHAVLAALGRYYLQNNEVGRSKSCFDEAVGIARKANSPGLLFRALANRGVYSGYGDPQKGRDLREALALSRELRDTVGEIEMLTRIYEIDFVHMKYDTVRKQLERVTELEEAIGYRHIHYNYYVLSYLYYTSGDYVNVFSYAKKAIEVMEANGDLAFSNFFYGNLANIYARFDNYEKALEWLRKGLGRSRPIR
ncbi:hypothetical protein ACQ86N_29750 [Puia sp. P3]|uniref:hypothetical protein n=1 Tax=Puia sp. P3 TaxID=3423952 RepID=UPI003D66EE46